MDATVLDQQSAVVAEANAGLCGGVGLHQLANITETKNATHIFP
jgi:hypothetical protein